MQHQSIPGFFCGFFNDTATTEIYTLSLHDALPICDLGARVEMPELAAAVRIERQEISVCRAGEHDSAGGCQHAGLQRNTGEFVLPSDCAGFGVECRDALRIPRAGRRAFK